MNVFEIAARHTTLTKVSLMAFGSAPLTDSLLESHEEMGFDEVLVLPGVRSLSEASYLDEIEDILLRLDFAFVAVWDLDALDLDTIVAAYETLGQVFLHVGVARHPPRLDALQRGSVAAADFLAIVPEGHAAEYLSRLTAPFDADGVLSLRFRGVKAPGRWIRGIQHDYFSLVDSQTSRFQASDDVWRRQLVIAFWQGQLRSAFGLPTSSSHMREWSGSDDYRPSGLMDHPLRVFVSTDVRETAPSLCKDAARACWVHPEELGNRVRESWDAGIPCIWASSNPIVPEVPKAPGWRLPALVVDGGEASWDDWLVFRRRNGLDVLTSRQLADALADGTLLHPGSHWHSFCTMTLSEALELIVVHICETYAAIADAGNHEDPIIDAMYRCLVQVDAARRFLV